MGDNNDEGSYGGGFSAVVGACFTLNYIMGIGFLTLPYAFHAAGWILSTVVMVIICIAAKFGSDYILSAMARAEHVVSELSNLKPAGEASGDVSGSGDLVPNFATIDGREDFSSNPSPTAADEKDGGNPEETPSSQADEKDMLLIGSGRSFDLSKLCRMFLGEVGFRAYGVMNGLHLYGLLWVYTSVFAHAMERTIPLFGVNEGDSYPMWVLIYAAIVIPMSVMDLSEQRTIQLFLSWCRIAGTILMIVTPIAAALVSDRAATTVDVLEEKFIAGNPHFGNQLKPKGSPMFRLAGFYLMFPILSFSTVFHHSVPVIASEVRDKSQLSTMFGMTLLLCGVVFCLIGGVGAWYFGDQVEESVNLNWDKYHAGTGRIGFDEIRGHLMRTDIAWWATLISLFVVLFPALDVISAFPLNALCLGKTLETAFLVGSESNVNERRISTLFRFFACYPPLVGALFVREVGKIAGFTGVFGIAIQFCFPALLYIISERESARLSVRSRTHYEKFGSSTTIAKIVFAFGFVSMLFIFLVLCIHN